MKSTLNVRSLRFIAAAGLSVGLVASSGVVSAQDSGVPTINADGNSGTSTAGLNPSVDASGPDIVYGDLNTGPGINVIGPPISESAPLTKDVIAAPVTNPDVSATNGNAAAVGPGSASAAPGSVTSGSSGTSLLGPDGTYSVSEVSPSNVTVGESGVLAPAPVTEAAPTTELAPEPVVETVETVEPVVADTAIASDTDRDGDNYTDALEWDLGLDGNNPDSDGDGVADGDELNIYGTEPTLYDSDYDGISDGEELFGIMTDPLVWDTDGDGARDGEIVTA
ncbi:MAG: hypothetical protein H0V00_03685 [Chloroflexia bacterium]|nr:hypothetical protein [Chloroflexia bacterium]